MTNRYDFNHFWSFLETTPEVTYEEIVGRTQAFDQVTLPHDWLIYDTKNLYRNSTGWYLKRWHLSDYLKDHQLEDDIMGTILRFEGIYMDCTIYLNNQKVGEWKYGYTTFEVDLTAHLLDGENLLIVKVCHLAPNSRWYSGAGIYRNVWLITHEGDYLSRDNTYVSMKREDERWTVTVDTTAVIKRGSRIRHRIVDGKRIISEGIAYIGSDGMSTTTMYVSSPVLWSTDEPKLYALETMILSEAGCVDSLVQSIGFKEVIMDPEEGFFLNGVSMKLNGVCEHHDLGCLGSAFSKKAAKKRLLKLKAMGVNAIRTAHNMPAPELMDLCDEMGIMVVSEAFDMWAKQKTTYDYARFFEEWSARDVERWVLRDRNHVSLIMWSIGNEIYDTHIDRSGEGITKDLMALVNKYDPKGNAPVTIGSNYMPWENAQRCADLVKVAGYNYAEKYYEQHHKAHTDWLIYGSETGSIVQSRGIYHFPLSRMILTDDDCQCSALGNSSTSWGAPSLEACICVDSNLPFSMGQFIWTGYDYIGEPTPYHTKNSYFGQIDTAGFEKDTYYAYQSAWTKSDEAPMIHIAPYWCFNEGQIIDVRVYTNGASVELLLNDISLGIKDVDHSNAESLIADWQVAYVPGTLKAIAYNQEGKRLAETYKHSFCNPSSIVVNIDQTTLQADGEDLLHLTVMMADDHGHIVENANNTIEVLVEGKAYLLGMDNGDSTDYDAYKGHKRRLFSGKCLVVIGSGYEAGEATITVRSQGLADATIQLAVTKVPLEGEKARGAASGTMPSGAVMNEPIHKMSYKPVRQIHLTTNQATKVIRSKEEVVEVEAVCMPADADDQTLIWRVVDDAGIDSTIARMEQEGQRLLVSAVGDGVFHVRCMVKNGKDHADIISQIPFEAVGLGPAYLNPYEFISAGLYDWSEGVVTSGNERGVATARDGVTIVGFHDVDFGEVGASSITMPIFALTDEAYDIEIWEGMPGEEGSECLCEGSYQKPSKWNVYQEEIFELKSRMTGITSIAFRLNKKVHIKGFLFEKVEKAYEVLSTLACDQLYGDSYVATSWGISEIGNNVTLVYNGMNFSKGLSAIEMSGRSISEKNSIRIQFTIDGVTTSQVVEMTYSEALETVVLPLENVVGEGMVEFVFLPGSRFDFEGFRFLEA